MLEFSSTTNFYYILKTLNVLKKFASEFFVEMNYANLNIEEKRSFGTQITKL